MKDLVLCVVDTETTGAPCRDGHRVIEIGAVKIRNLEIKEDEKFDSLIQTGRKSDMGAQLVHNISEDDLKDAPIPEEVIPSFLDYVSDVDYLIAQNAIFDKEFLLNEVGLVDPFSTLPEFLCTKKFSKMVYPHEKYHNLDTQLQRAGVIFEGSRHRAFDDAWGSANVFLHLYENSPTKEKEDIIKRILE